MTDYLDGSSYSIHNAAAAPVSTEAAEARITAIVYKVLSLILIHLQAGFASETTKSPHGGAGSDSGGGQRAVRPTVWAIAITDFLNPPVEQA
jgi:hypothetical protein